MVGGLSKSIRPICLLPTRFTECSNLPLNFCAVQFGINGVAVGFHLEVRDGLDGVIL